MGHWTSLRSEGQVTVDAMNLMGYDALAVGRLELAAGVEALKARVEEAEFAILSGNILVKGSDQPIFEPYVIIERDDAKIGIIGISEAEVVQAPGMADAADMLHPVEAAEIYVPMLRDQVDILVVLSHAGKEVDRLMAKAVPGINVIVGGKDRELMKMPEQEGNTLLVQQGYRGEWIGRLTMSLDANGVPFDFAEEIIQLDDVYREDEDMAALVKPYREKYPTPTPQPTWTPDPRTPTANWTATIEAYQTLTQETRVAQETLAAQEK